MKPNSCSFARSMRIGIGLCTAMVVGISIYLADVSAQSPGQVPVPLAGRNVNMASGTTLPGGDPFLQRQNEPTLAVSTRNPLHILGAANDYRTVDIPGLGESVVGDAWIGIFKSFDGGSTWMSTLLPGFRQDPTQQGRSSPLYGLQAGADPVLRAGTNGLFYLGGMAFNRDQDAGKVFVSRYIDNNNLEKGDSIAYLSTTVVDTGSADRFLDKPWIAVDIPRVMKGRGRDDKDDRDDRGKVKDKKDKDWKQQDNTKNGGIPRKPTSGPVCRIPGQAQPIPAGNIYVVYSAFLDPGVQAAADPNKSARELEIERGERTKRRHDEWKKRKPGQPVEGRTKIMLARSDDCGATFSRPIQISERTQINQGAVMAIDPNNGNLYVAWREFLSASQPNRILVTRSTDGGKTFRSPVSIATINPFDQGTTATSFRTNTYPAMSIDGTGRVYVAWAQRGVGPGGDARIVVSTSTNGRIWSAPEPADDHPGRGHQLMPVLTFGGGKLNLVFWDQRDDVSRLWGEYIDDYTAVNWTGPRAQQPKRHTLDLRAIAAWPGAPPTWGPSSKISNYLEGVLPGNLTPQQLQYNPPNLPLFGLGTKPFFGDYLDVTVAPSFIANGDGTWRFNTQLSDPAHYFTAWGDNRDVRAPADGNWVHYTPPTFAGYTGTSIYDPTQSVEMCTPGQAGMRDQNVYSAKVSSGLVVSTPGNNKRLGYVTGPDGVRRLIQRTFVITVANPDETAIRSVVLHIPVQPPGGTASFLQFEPLFDLPLNIAPRSSVSREVFVTSTDPAATVAITVTEGTSTSAAARLFLNPDPTNPDIDNPDIDNPDIDNPDIDNAEAHNITVSNPTITNPDIDNIARANPDIDNPDIDNPDIDNSLLANLAIINPDIDNPDIDNPDIDNVDIVNPDIDNPDIDNPDIDNGALTDITWNVSNVGNTATAYQVKMLLKQAQQQRLLNAGVRFQLVVTKTTAAPTISRCAVVEPNRNLSVVTINSPSFVDPTNPQQVSTVINPDIDNPDIDNATLALAPGDTARVTLRVYSPIGDTTAGGGGAGDPDPLDDLTGALADLQNLGVATTSHPVDTLDVIAGATTPQIEASIPLIITETLDDAVRGVVFTDQIEQTGSTAPFSFAIAAGALPPGLTLNADGSITGVALVSGSFTFTVRLTDASEGVASATLTLRVAEPVQVVTGSLAGAGVNQAYSGSVSAIGGFGPYAWSLAGGSLPAGVTLTPAGTLTGTPTQSGAFNFVAMAQDSGAPRQAATGAFALGVSAAANSQSVNVVEDTATPITVSGTGGGSFTFAIGNQPANGTLSGSGPVFTYTPDSNFTGVDSFTFSATQDGLTSAPATVSITVTPVNDAPTATPATVNTPQGVAVPIVLTGTDPENSPVTFSIFAAPTAGSLSGTAPNVTYTPPAGFTGTATFQFRVNDGAGFSTPATVSVIVGPPPANSADLTLALVDAPDPVALGASVTYTATIHNNGPAAATGVTLNLAYPVADLLVQTVTPSQGSCTSGATVACAIGAIANGGDVTVAITMRAYNRGGAFSVSSTVSGTLLDYNTTNNAAVQGTTVSGPAVATADLQVSQNRAPDPVAFGENVVYTILVTNNGPSDATGVALTNTFTASSAQFIGSTASQGSCLASAGRVSCSVGDLAAGATATHTLTLRANGPGSLSNVAVVSGSQVDPNGANNSDSLDTTIANRAPTAVNDQVTTTEDVPVSVSVVDNDTDPDHDTLRVFAVGAAPHGATMIESVSRVQYGTEDDYYGPDSFTYQISDGRGGIASATINVTVLAVNDAPSFTRGADQTAGQGGGVRTVEGWASAITTGPANEAGQTVSFIVSSNNRNLFSAQPAIAPNGTLTFTPAAVASGVATVTVTAVDNGGTDNGGVDSSASQTFTITINATGNVPPSFTAGPNVTTNEDAGAFVPVNNAGGGRNQHTATRLADGRVLIAGGAGSSGILTGAELYDPSTRTQQPTGSMNVARVGHTATLLPNGLVLIAGGADGDAALDSAELFNPVTGAFTPTTGRLTVPRLGHTATLLPNNRVLVAGGHGMDFDPLDTAEIFDPVTNTFSLTGTMVVPRSTHSAARLADGRVLVVAGYTTGILTSAAAEIYDPSTGLFTLTGSLARARGGETATLLPNNMVLVAGGVDESFYVLSSELYDPATGAFTAGPNLSAGRYAYGAELLSNGTVLLAGGRTGVGANDPEQYLASAETYNPATHSFSATGAMAIARTDFRLTALSDGSVLASGGFNTDILIGASELYESPGLQAIPWATAISAGPAAESGQAVDFIVTNNNTALFSEQPAIDPSGALTFRSVANANGSATVTVRLHDDGGIADGGADTSAPQTFAITVTEVNDPPRFDPVSGLYQVSVDAGPQTVPAWVSGISAGPANEASQQVTFLVTNDNAAAFAAQPAISPDGTLTFTLAAGETSGATVTVRAQDNGGALNGGNDTSPPQNFIIGVSDRPVVAVTDPITTTTNTPFTFSPSANDRDPDVASPAVVATVPGGPAGAPWLVGPGDVAIVESTGLAYFSGGLQSVASPGAIGILDTGTSTITGSMAIPVKSNQTLSRVNQTTNIAYFRGSALTAVDGRPGSPTFNQVILSLQLGNIQSMALDEPRGRLYLTSSTSGTTSSLFQSRIILVDVDPSSPTFHQVVDQGPAFGDGNAVGIGVNTVTNKIYVAVNGGFAPGVYAIDGVTLNETLIASTTNPVSILVNDAANLVYAVTGTSLYVIDGATDTRLALIMLPANGSQGTVDTRIAVHKASGQVYVRLFEFPNPSRLAVIDGNRTSPTFNTILTYVALGREDGAMVAVDEDADRVVATSNRDLETAVIDTTTNAVIATIPSTQLTTRIAIDREHHRAYITGGIGVIQSIDLVTGSLHATVPVGTETTFLALNPVTHTAYVPETALTTGVRVVNGTGSVGSIPLPHGDGRELFAVANSGTNRIYVLNGGATAAGGSDALPGFVHVIDGATNQSIASVPVGPVPFGLGINTTTNKIYVGNGSVQSGVAFGGGITVIDGATYSTVEADLSQIPRSSTNVGQISVGRDIVANPTTGKVYFRILSGSTTTLGVLNGATNVATPLPPFAGGGGLNIIRVNPVLNRVYLGEQVTNQTGRIHILDGTTDQEIAVVTAGSPSAFIGTQSYLAVNRVSGRVFVADFLQDSVAVIDPATNTIIGTVRVGDGPTAVAVNETLNRVYVGSNYDKTLTIIDGATLRVVATLPMPSTAVRFDVDEAASLIFSTPGPSAEPRVMVISDPGTVAPAIVSVTNGAFGAVTLNGDGSVTYAPNAGFTGADSFTYSVPDGLGGFTTGTVNVTVAAPLTINGVLPDAVIDTPYTQTLTATGGTGPYAWSVAGSAPGGLAINGLTGVVSGFTTQAGTFSFTVQVLDLTTLATATRAFTVRVGPPVITTTGLPSGFVGTPYNATVIVGGATGEVQWTLDTGGSPLLSWLSISNGGVLSGTPPNAGSTPSFTVRATDAAGQVATRLLTLFVGAALDISPTQLREGVVLETQASLPLVGGNGTRAVTLTAGTLPPGLTLNSNGTFTGTPRRHGTYTFTVQATDCTPATTCLNTVTQQTVSRELTLRVSAKEQQGSSQSQPAIAFGGPGGRRFAQVVTVGAQGTLTGIGLQNISCPSFGPVTIDIQRLAENGLPDGVTIATGTSVNSLFGAITVAPAVALPIGAQFAFIVSSPTACTFSNAAVTDQYNGGDAYVDAGAGWASLFSTDGRYDVPSFRTLIQPAMDVGYLSNSRGSGSTATLLNNGTVLLTGPGTSAEIYDPATNSTTLTGSMWTARNSHTATLLQDGTVLIVGGQTGGVRIATAETYDPSTGTFSLTSGSMSVGRDAHAATRMNDGRVLITGGVINFDTSTVAVATAEIYDPISRAFTAAPNMTSTRQWHNSVLLQSGKVLVASGYIGGSSSRSAELYDPITNIFTATVGSMSMPRGFSAAEMLTDGRVLISGGQNGPVRNTAEIYDPVTDNFTTVGSMATLRYQHTMTRLADGSVLVAGGFDEGTVSSYVLPLASMERFIPTTNSFVPAGAMEARRARHNAIRLPNGSVFLAGAAGQSWMSANTGELYTASAAPSLTTTTAPDGQVGIDYPATMLVATGGSGGPYQIALASGLLPPGIALDGAATLSGTPLVNGVFPVGIRITDSLDHSTVETLTIRVGAALVITTPYQLPSGVLNHAYDVQLTASEPVVWSLAPASSIMPVGLVLGADGRITGTPTEFFGRTFSVRAVDALGRSVQKTFSISIQNPLAITTTVLPEAAVRESYTFCLSSLNGVTSNTWSISGGALPAGVSLQSNGCFTNPPSALGTYNFTVQVTDLASPPQVVTRDVTIRVSAREQQSFSQTQPTIAFGGAGGRRLAQTITVGASGTLTAFGFNSTTNCAAPVTVDVQRLDAFGRPDGTTIASGSLQAGLGGIAISPAINVGIGDRIAFVLSSTGACTIADVPITDRYHAGESFADAGSGWVSLVDSDGRYDIPFRSMIEPSNPVVFLQRPRGEFEMTALGDGRVLMTGNNNTAEIYDPLTRTSTLTGNMSTARTNHTGTLLPDGSVLIAGGRDSSGNRLATAETYNPATGTFTLTAGQLSVPHEEHTATLMNDGRVLIAGGFTQVGTVYQSIGTAEIYDPSTRTFSPAGSMLTARHVHTAALLADGRVLLIGGFTSGPVFRSAEIYDPITGTFTGTTGSMLQTRGRAATARLADGRILITGGQAGDIVNTAEIYDPVTDSFMPTGSMLSPRQAHTATTLADGSVLVAGGLDQSDASGDYILSLATMERWIPGSNTFVPAGSLVARHKYHSAASLPDGSVLIAGGYGQSWMTGQTAEIFDPAASLTLSPGDLPDAAPGVAYSATFTVGGGTSPHLVELVSGSLPLGLSYNSATLTLSGTPTSVGAFTLGFRVTDSATHQMEQSFTLRVGSLNTVTNPYRLTDASLGQPYSLQLTASGAAPITWFAGPPSNLPPGLVMSSSGLISGSPTTQSYYNFAVRAVDANGQLAVKTLSINVLNPPIFATTAVPVAALTESYTYCLATTGGVGTTTFDVVGGALPNGISLQSSGCFSNTPTTLGNFPVTIRATDQSSGQATTRSFDIRVSARDQQANTQTGTTIFFGGPGGRRLAQTVTAGVNGLLTAVGSNNVFCSAISVAIQGVRNDGLPDGVTVASGSFQSNLTAIGGIPLTPAIPVTIGSRFAVVFSSDTLCDVTNAPATFDGYVAGDAYADTGAGWVPLMSTDGRFDLPSVRSLVQPAVTPGLLTTSRVSHVATPLNDGRVLVTNFNSPEVFDPATNTSVLTGSMTTLRSGSTATRLADGTVLVVGGSNFSNNTTPYPTLAEIFDPVTNTFSAVPGPMNFGRSGHTATRLSDGTVLIAGGSGQTSLLQGEIYNPVSQTFTLVGAMVAFRSTPTATLLQDGRVLIVGGNTQTNIAEVYDPITQTFSPTGSTTVPRFSGITATLLADGRVLIIGGQDSVSPGVRNSAELYDPVTGTFTATGSMLNARQFHTAALLPDGSVLVSGGRNLTNAARPLSQHERYLPASGTFVSAGGMLTMRSSHTATGISGGRVVLIGGTSTAGLTGISAEIYDPARTPALTGVPLPDAVVDSPYAGVTLGATAGSGAPYTIALDSGSLPSGLTFNPATLALGVNETPSAAGVFTFGMRVTDSLGHVVVEPVTLRVSPLDITTLALPAPAFGTPYSFALGATGVGSVTWSLFAGALPQGLSLVGNVITGTPTSTATGSFTLRAVDSAGQVVKQSFNLSVASPPVDQQGSSAGGVTAISFGGPGGRRLAQTVTAAANASLVGVGSFSITCPASTTVTFEIQGVAVDGRPDGITLATGSGTGTGNTFSGLRITPSLPMMIGSRYAIVMSSTAACDVGNAPSTTLSTFDGYVAGDGYADAGGGWTLLSDTDGRTDVPFRTLVQLAADVPVLRSSRSSHTAFPLNDGKILLFSSFGSEVFDPATNTSVTTGATIFQRTNATATLLANGTVLVTGGQVFANNTTTYLPSAEIFDPATGSFTLVAGSMGVGRSQHSAVRLPDGRVLITGGLAQLVANSSSIVQSAEIYDPATQTFTSAGNMSTYRYGHTSTLLADGTVLLAGGYTSQVSAETYDSVTGTFTATVGGLQEPRQVGSTVTLLADGRVLFTGGPGTASPSVRRTAELYDPASRTFAATGQLIVPRMSHAAALLPDGSVLISGGRSLQNAARSLSTMERYVPGSGTFIPAGGMATLRSFHTATPTADGRVLIAGGSGGATLAFSTAEFYDPASAVALTGVPLPDAQLNVAYAGVVLGATGGSGAPYSIALESGALPPGLTYNAGTFELGVGETPGALGTYVAGMRVTDSAGHTRLEPLPLRVSPLDITTTVLPQPTQNQPYSFTLGATGVGAVTWSVYAGSLPVGLSLVGNTITGTPTTQTSYSFTLLATDSAGQRTKQSYSLFVQQPPADQQSSWDISRPALVFGGATRVGQRVRTGVTGTLVAARPSNLVCPAGTIVTAEIQGHLPSGAPDGVTIASGTATAATFASISLSPQIFFAAEAEFALVFSTDQQCQLYPTLYDSYAGGEGFVATPQWQRLTDVDGRYDIPFLTFVQPVTPLTLMTNWRGDHTATTLIDGRVLLVSSGDSVAEVYDPATGTFTSTGNLRAPRSAHRTSLLGDGTVLVTGGYNYTGPGNTFVIQNTAEIFHPDTLTFEMLPATMSSGRYEHSSTTLLDGVVLIAGGYSGGEQTAQLYDPITRTFSPNLTLLTQRVHHTATLLGDGRVLLHGGYSGFQSEVFNPATGTFTATATPVVSYRNRHTATLLSNGTVLIAGGGGSAAGTTAEVFNPVGGTFTAAGTLQQSRVEHTATLLPDGSVLMAGGYDDSGTCCSYPPHSSMERYVPGTGFVGAGSMQVARYQHTASSLADGSALLAGTYGWSSIGGRTVEVFDPTTAVALVSVAAPAGYAGTAYAGFTLAGSGGVGGPYTIAHRSGRLPNGLTYAANAFAGTPTESGTFTMTFTVSDGAGNANSQTVTVRIDPLAITTSSLPNAPLAVAYNAQLTATGLTPVTWTLAPGSSLPAGLTLNSNGSITGTPTMAQYASFNVRATDPAGQVAQRSLSIYVFNP